MSKQIYNNQTITEYLLGSLPETETERFDELSITNDEFAETLKAAEKDLVDAYVQGELSEAELERFESHYLASPLRREKLDFAQAFQVLSEKNALAQDAEAQLQDAAAPAKKTKTSGWFSSISIFPDRRLALQWGFAAMALAFLIAGGWLALENVRLRRQMSQTQARREALGLREQELQKELEKRRTADEKVNQELARVREERERLEQELKQQETGSQQRASGQPPAGEQRSSSPGGASIASFILAPQLRSAGQIQTLSVPAGTDYVALRLALEPNDYPAFRAVLLDQSNSRTLWRSGKLKARATNDGKALNVSFNAGLLGPRLYVLRVSGVAANGASEIVGDYQFRVVNQ